MKFCSSCGKKIGDNAVTCPRCGEPTKGKVIRKKWVAITLAVLLGQWAWLYTYKHDAWKFWIAWLINFVGMALLFIPNIGVWIWSIVDAVGRDDNWYKKY